MPHLPSLSTARRLECEKYRNNLHVFTQMKMSNIVLQAWKAHFRHAVVALVPSPLAGAPKPHLDEAGGEAEYEARDGKGQQR